MPTNKDDVPGKRRYLSAVARREEILDAALIEFADRTYNAVSMERLAECAGLSKAGIYAHFNSKESSLKYSFGSKTALQNTASNRHQRVFHDTAVTV